MCVGVNVAPPRWEDGVTLFGFTVGERVKVKEGDLFFANWHGHVRGFEDELISVDLDEPPPGHQENGQWFSPEKLEKAPAT